MQGFRFGLGNQRVSLLGGCHADEPVGPRLLRHLAGYLSTIPADDPILHRYQWWIIPHINPDGEARNSVWYDGDDETYDLGRYLAGVIREPPGDDIEFGFPRNEQDTGRLSVVAFSRWPVHHAHLLPRDGVCGWAVVPPGARVE